MHGRGHVNICQALVPCGVEQPHSRWALQRHPHTHTRASHAVHGVVFVQTTAERRLRKEKKICALQNQLHLRFRINHRFSNSTDSFEVIVLPRQLKWLYWRWQHYSPGHTTIDRESLSCRRLLPTLRCGASRDCLLPRRNLIGKWNVSLQGQYVCRYIGLVTWYNRRAEWQTPKQDVFNQVKPVLNDPVRNVSIFSTLWPVHNNGPSSSFLASFFFKTLT